MHKVHGLSCKAPHISHEVTSLILNLTLHTEDLDGIGDTVIILMFPDLSLSARPEEMVVERR